MKIVKSLSLVLIILSFVSCSDSGSENLNPTDSSHVYTCPMHPEVISDQPGNCPKCNMKLVLQNQDGNSEYDYLLQPTNEYVLSEISTVQLAPKKLNDVVQVTGTIEYDPREIHSVSARVSGRVEKLYVKYEFEPIRKGQKLLEIYSEELLTEQENYIFLLTYDKDNITLIQAAEKRLELLGLDSGQIEKLKKNKIAIQSVTITSPYSGHLHTVDQNASDKLNDNSSMSGMSSEKSNAVDLWLREGAYVSKGENLFTVYNTKRVWAILNIPSEHLANISPGLPVKIWFSSGETDTIYSAIAYVEPILNQQSNSMLARVYLDNPYDKYKIGTTLNAEINLGEKQGEFIPESAVLNIGKDNVVFIKKDKVFVSRLVQIGVKINGFVEIISGIEKDEKIAQNAQMMVDSESFVVFTTKTK